jgi:hypothetical protein
MTTPSSSNTTGTINEEMTIMIIIAIAAKVKLAIDPAT